MGGLEYCPACGVVRPVEHASKAERISIRGEDVEVCVEGSRCTACKEFFSDAAQMERNLEAAYAILRKRHFILAPAEIRELREGYGASQKAFGIILGFGELTINSYEQGALPADANANLLRLVENPADFRQLYDARKELIGPTQRRRIENALAKLEAKAHSTFVLERPPLYARTPSCEPSIYTGFVAPDKERLFALIQAILRFAGRPLYKTQILKLLFYCDFSHFRRSTVSLSGWRYAAIPYGPVPDDFQALLPEATDRGLLACELDESQEGELYSLSQEGPKETAGTVFSEEELDTVRDVVERLGAKTSKYLVELTHTEKAWKETAHAKLISYEWAQELVGV